MRLAKILGVSMWSTPMGSSRPLDQPCCVSCKPSGTNYLGRTNQVKGKTRAGHTNIFLQEVRDEFSVRLSSFGAFLELFQQSVSNKRFYE